MQKAEPQKAHAQSQPAVRQGKGVAAASPQSEQIAQLEAMMDSSPQIEKQRDMATMMNASPAMAAQRKMFGMIHNSPGQAAQRKFAEGINNSPMMAAQHRKFEAVQRVEEEEPLQGKFDAVQRIEDEEPLQGKFASESPAQLEQQAAAKPNNTGLPDNLKSGIENLSGMSMDHVKVHYNSSQPAQLNALAYAQGSDIHVAPGQEQHLPHEAWHVVQQAQGRVKPTMQMKGGVPVNDDAGLEREADVMGAKALADGGAVAQRVSVARGTVATTFSNAAPVVQAYFVFADSPSQIKAVPKLFRIEGSIEINQTLARQAADDNTEYKVYDWNEAIDNVLRFMRTARGDDTETISATTEIDLDKVVVEKGSSDVTLKELSSHKQLQQADAEKKRGYAGTAIVWTGESNAADLADKYASHSQDWGATERKARLAVNFGINNRAEFLEGKNASAESDVRNIALQSFNKTKDKVSTIAQGWTWGYTYAKGGLPKSTTEQVSEYLKTGRIDDSRVIWKKKALALSRTEALVEFVRIRGTAGAPYGALRSRTGSQTAQIESHLKDSNNAGEVYVHSIDADAPDFSTLKKGSKQGTWKKVLDAYDETLDAQDHDVVIGGYNLLADPEKYTGKDYQYTVQSNVVDLAIRQAVHSAEPLMTYPTEPNFIIRAGKYTQAQLATKGNVWGSTAYEGRNFIDNYITSQNGKRAKADIHYDALASVPTGIDKGGARLKIDSAKKYDKDSIFGRPLYDTTSKIGDTIPLEDQYVVQAQSWAGASRIATAFRSAYKVKTDRNFPSESKDESIQAFAAVELMVKALVSGKSVADIALDVSAFDNKYKGIAVGNVLKAISSRLQELEKNRAFWLIIK